MKTKTILLICLIIGTTTGILSIIFQYEMINIIKTTHYPYYSEIYNYLNIIPQLFFIIGFTYYYYNSIPKDDIENIIHNNMVTNNNIGGLCKIVANMQSQGASKADIARYFMNCNPPLTKPQIGVLLREKEDTIKDYGQYVDELLKRDSKD